jgi:hypothetical protein
MLRFCAEVFDSKLLTSVCIISKCWQLGWLVGDPLCLRDFGPYGIIFINVCVIITVAMVMLLGIFGSYRIVFMTMCVLL